MKETERPNPDNLEPVTFEEAIPVLLALAKEAALEPVHETALERAVRLAKHASRLQKLERYGSLHDRLALAVTSMEPNLAFLCRVQIRQRLENSHDRLSLAAAYDDFQRRFDASITWISRADMDARFEQILNS